MHPTPLPLLQQLPPKIFAALNSPSQLRPSPQPTISLLPIRPLASSSSSPRLRFARVRCSLDGTEPSLPEDVVSRMVEELLQREENRGLLEGLEKASQRVDRAREALADIERQEADALRAKEHVLELRDRESQIAESQRELLEARALVEEAQHSLSSKMDDKNLENVPNAVNQDVERLESIKTALVSSIIGTLAGLPISFIQATNFAQLALHLITIFISCALFGVTFRYTIRRDLDNIQLKTGTSAAFGFVKGLAAVDAGKPLEPNFDSLISYAVNGTVHISENIFVFLFSAIALDFCFKMRFLSPFPIRKEA